MNKENRYLVLKRDDLSMALNSQQENQLLGIVNDVENWRESNGNRQKSFVVVADDWPMYDDTWRAIAQYVDTGEYTRTNTDLEELTTSLARSKTHGLYLESVITKVERSREEAQTQVRVLTEALSHAVKVIQDSDEWWMDCPDKGGFDLDRLEQALSSSPITTYQAERAVIEAAQGTECEGGGCFMPRLMKAVDALQELEHNNAGGE